MNERPWEVTHNVNSLQGKTVQDFIYFEGMYNPILRFAFTNVLGTEFKSFWNSQLYTIQPHETVKLTHHLAVKFTKELVDKMMQADGKAALMAIPAQRKPYEDRILTLLPIEHGVELQVIKSEFIEKVQRDANRPANVADEPLDAIELPFDDLTKQRFSPNETALGIHNPVGQEVKPEVIPVEKKKPGRPKKV